MFDTLFSELEWEETEYDPLAGQYRLAEVQVANWGTFDGLHKIPVARKGHLITGGSGSGKSSLLDGMAAVITPDKWLNFNQAASAGTGRADQRTKMSYVRGAWRRQSDELEDRVVTDFLRKGPTWSGVLLRYEDAEGNAISLGRLFFAKGTGVSSDDLSSVRLFSKTALNLEDFEEYLLTGIETRRVKKAFPQVDVTTIGSHTPFFRRARNAFGLADDEAFQLLHKTQSTKNLGGLDQLFRTYMLDEPGTFQVADNAIEQFTELSSAYEQVVELRKQRDHLLLLREAAQKYDADSDKTRDLETLALAVRTYESKLKLRLAQEELIRVTEQVSTANDAAQKTQAAVEEAETRLETAREKNLALGGSDVAQLQTRIDESEQALQGTLRREAVFHRLLRQAGVESTPVTSADFEALLSEVKRTIKAGEAALPPGATTEEFDRLHAARNKVRRLNDEFNSVRRTGSTIPRRLQDVRNALAGTLEVDEASARDLLPFAGELISVKPSEEEWTGAIERVLGSFGLTLLVRPEHLNSVRRFVDSHNLGTRLQYEAVGEPERATPSPSAPNSLIRKVEVRDGYFHPWVMQTLVKRFDYSCVRTADGLAKYAPSVSLNGQIRLGRHRYVKDDRHAITDRSRWVLGDHTAKLEELADQRNIARKEEAEADRVVEKAQQLKEAAQVRLTHQKKILDQHWDDIDVGATKAHIRSLEESLRSLTADNHDLARSAEEVFTAKQSVREAKRQDKQAQERLTEKRVTRRNLEKEVTSLEALKFETLSVGVEEALAERFLKGRRSISRAQVPQVAGRVEKELHSEQRQAAKERDLGARRLTELQTLFKQTWPDRAVDLTNEIADRERYLNILSSIESRGLPEHEQRFLALFRDRSRDLVSTLNAEILQAFAEVKERVHPINQSLRTVPYNEGKYLRLDVKNSRPKVADDFLADLKSITTQTVGADDMEVAEPRYQTLERIMRDLGSSDYQMKEWRRNCLDTRLHVSFRAEEVEEDGTVFQTLDTGVALSGGQQQKLAFFCLAAALKFKLADADEPYPKYATVVLDEAFDRADAEYTRTALEVFKTFGLHLVVATPDKLLQTIDPYIGGATHVQNPARNHSQVAAIQWDETRKTQPDKTQRGKTQPDKTQRGKIPPVKAG